jgi:hypothetical protein
MPGCYVKDLARSAGHRLSMARSAGPRGIKRPKSLRDSFLMLKLFSVLVMVGL